MIKLAINKTLVLLIMVSVLPLMGFSQKWKLARYEILGGIGTVSYFGDIGGAESADAMWISDFLLSHATCGQSDIEIKYE